MKCSLRLTMGTIFPILMCLRGLKGNLKGKAWIITTHNMPGLIVPFAQDYGKILKNQVLKACGISPVTISRIASVEKISDQERRKVLNRIIQKAKKL